MAVVVYNRSFTTPSLKRTVRKLALAANLKRTAGQFVTIRSIIVRTHFVARTGGRKAALRVGLLIAGRLNRNVLLYRKLQWPEQRYPVFTPFTRRVKVLGNKVAPVISTGGGGVGMNLQHALGLSLLALGGTRY